MYEREIELKARGLPEHLKRQVLDFMEFLLKKYRGGDNDTETFKFDWEGGLSDLQDKYTSDKVVLTVIPAARISNQ